LGSCTGLAVTGRRLRSLVARWIAVAALPDAPMVRVPYARCGAARLAMAPDAARAREGAVDARGAGKREARQRAWPVAAGREL
jgi:hypothetical protein